jgi:hypothetical protein
MKAIEKVWEENLKKEKENQYKSKQEIIEDRCPYGFELDLKEPTYCLEDYNKEVCTRCWNREMEEDSKETLEKYKSTFEELRTSPINTDIVINENNENNFSKAVKDNDIIVYIENDTDIYYDDIPKIIKWLQDVYDYSTELKNRVEYVDFKTAKTHMKNDNGCELDGYFYDKDSEFTIKDIESNKWILL